MKQLAKGLDKCAVQVFRPVLGNNYILGAVGVLQFEVTMARLKDEYGVEAISEGINYNLARWVSCDDAKQLKAFEAKCQGNLAFDAEGHLAFLADGQWRIKAHCRAVPGDFFS